MYLCASRFCQDNMSSYGAEMEFVARWYASLFKDFLKYLMLSGHPHENRGSLRKSKFGSGGFPVTDAFSPQTDRVASLDITRGLCYWYKQ